MTYGTPEELSSDGGQNHVVAARHNFLATWDVSHRVSSAYFPHSNLKADIYNKAGSQKCGEECLFGHG